MYRLIFLNGPQKGRRLVVQRGDLTIGRDHDCGLILDTADGLAGHHVVIESRRDGIWLKHLGYGSEPLVNGQRMAEAKLRTGDEFEIGGAKIEYREVEVTAATKRRGIGGVEIAAGFAVLLVFALQAFFMAIQFTQTPERIAQNIATVGVEDAAASAAVSAAPAAPAVPVVATNAVAAATGAPPTEADAIRAAVADLRAQVAQMTGDVERLSHAQRVPEPAAPGRPTNGLAVAKPIDAPPPEDRPAFEDPPADRAQELMAAVKAAVAAERWAEADALLERVQLMTPELVEAYAARARVLDRMGRLTEAVEQWGAVLERERGTPLAQEAERERARITRIELERMREEVAAGVAPGARPERRLRIVSMERERFPSTKEVDELRLVRVNLRPRPQETAVRGDAVLVQVVFYDRDTVTGAVMPTEAGGAPAELSIEDIWADGQSKTVTASFMVRKGARAEEAKRTGQTRAYEGFRVRVFYEGILQDEDAFPKNLMRQPAPPLPAALRRRS